MSSYYIVTIIKFDKFTLLNLIKQRYYPNDYKI